MQILYKTDHFLNNQPDDPPSIFLILRQSKVSAVVKENRTECRYG